MARLKTLIIAAPKGSLGEPTQEKFKKIGLHYDLMSKEAQFENKWKGIKVVVQRMRAQSIPRTILVGGADIGITGWDCVREDELERKQKGENEQGKLLIIRKLNYNKDSNGSVKVVVVRRKRDQEVQEIKDSEDLKILSEFPYLTRQHYPLAHIQPIIGGAEDEFAAHKEYDLAVCVTETGQSLEVRNLEIEKVLLKTTTVLIAREKKEEFEIFAELLEGAIDAPEYKIVKMHIPKEMIDKARPHLPALLEPNIVWLENKKVYSVETVAKISELFELRRNLKPLGVTGIVVKDIDIVIP